MIQRQSIWEKTALWNERQSKLTLHGVKVVVMIVRDIDQAYVYTPAVR